ncbi:MAG: hypothetical protein H0U67_00265 [Gemmatimonadetes bacterium]|nr:hypothetical protein [Gemmatimonadota bacterium]
MKLVGLTGGQKVAAVLIMTGLAALGLGLIALVLTLSVMTLVVGVGVATAAAVAAGVRRLLGRERRVERLDPNLEVYVDPDDPDAKPPRAISGWGQERHTTG